MSNLARLAIDFGTSNTVAVLDPGTGFVQPLLFGDSPLLPSAIHAADPGQLLTGRDAIRAARSSPECFEPTPKRRIDDGSVLLGAMEYPVTTLISAVLRTVANEARRVAGGDPESVALTHPANWGSSRLAVLRTAAETAGLGNLTLVPEPEAAAVFFTKSHQTAAPPETVVVYDFGGGTFDVCLLTLVDGKYQVRAQAGLDNVGGADLDAALLNQIGQTVSNVDADIWQRITQPSDPGTRRAFRALYDDIKDAKEQLSRNSHSLVHLPMLERDFPVTREEFEQVAGPLIERTVALTEATLSGAGLALDQPLSLFLVGGSSRVPLVSTMLHRGLGQPPIITGQPEQVVAQGALMRVVGQGVTSQDAVDTPPPVETLSPNATPEPDFQSQPASIEPRQPDHKERTDKRLVSIGAVVVLVLLAAIVWFLLPADEGGGKVENPSKNVSKEPAISQFTDEDTKVYDHCFYEKRSGIRKANGQIELKEAECDGAAKQGWTREVESGSRCGDDFRVDDYKAFESSPGNSGDFCYTWLFKQDNCLDKDFYTVACEYDDTAYIIESGPNSKNTCMDDGHLDSVKLLATDEYFCLGDFDF